MDLADGACVFTASMFAAKPSLDRDWVIFLTVSDPELKFAVYFRRKSIILQVKTLESQIYSAGLQEEGHFGAAVSAPPIRRWTTRRRTVSAADISAPDISAPFPIFFFRVMKKKQ